eukprot:365526-Chlamydomonas_euryale.AAC.7
MKGGGGNGVVHFATAWPCYAYLASLCTHVRTHAFIQYMHEGPRAFTLMCNRGRVVRAQNMRRGRRSRPITPVKAEAGLRPRTCMHVNARGRRPMGFCVHACPRPRAGRGRGRRDRPRR